jgi:hypothetical protein
VTWEYYVARMPFGEDFRALYEDQLNEAGAKGWELVFLDRFNNLLTFKRPVPENSGVIE